MHILQVFWMSIYLYFTTSLVPGRFTCASRSHSKAKVTPHYISIYAASVGTQTKLGPLLFSSAFSREPLAVSLHMARPSADLSGASPTHTAGRKLTRSKCRALFVGPVKWSNSAKGSRHHCWSKEDDSWTQGWGQGHEGEGQGAKPSAFSWT